MPKRVVDLREQRALLDIASYGRRGPGHRPLTRAEVEHVSRTARRVPEVMIKVSGGARSLRGVRAHLDYIGREGEGVVETDDGAQLHEKGFGKGGRTSPSTCGTSVSKPMRPGGRFEGRSGRRRRRVFIAP